MTPTRELALQITKECKKFSKTLGLRVVCVYGGTGISEQVVRTKRSVFLYLQVERSSDFRDSFVLVFGVSALKIFKYLVGN